MSSKTKIVLLKSRELLYCALFVALLLLLLLFFFLMFRPKSNHSSSEPLKEAASYTPGSYTSTITLGTNTLEVAVCVDSSHINGIHFVYLNDTVSVLYPLMDRVMNEIAAQVCSDQSANHISYQTENQYTSILLIQSIHEALDKARLLVPSAKTGSTTL